MKMVHKKVTKKWNLVAAWLSIFKQETVVNPDRKSGTFANFANSKLFSLKIDLPHKVCLTSSAKLERESTKNVSVICVGKVSDQVSASLKLKWTFYGPTWILWNRYCLHLFRVSPRSLLINIPPFFDLNKNYKKIYWSWVLTTKACLYMS